MPMTSSSEDGAPTSGVKRKASSTEEEDTELIIITITSNSGIAKEYIVHRLLACQHSIAINEACTGPTLDGQVRRFHFKGFDYPRAFGIIRDWLYNRNTEIWKERWGQCYMKNLYVVYILAFHLKMTVLASIAMEHIKNMPLTAKVPPGFGGWLYKNTGQEWSLRQHFCNHVACSAAEGGYTRESLGQLPKEALLDVIMGINKASRKASFPIKEEVEENEEMDLSAPGHKS